MKKEKLQISNDKDVEIDEDYIENIYDQIQLLRLKQYICDNYNVRDQYGVIINNNNKELTNLASYMLDEIYADDYLYDAKENSISNAIDNCSKQGYDFENIEY